MDAGLSIWQNYEKARHINTINSDSSCVKLVLLR